MNQQPIETILMRQLASYLSVPIVVVDRDGTMLFFNEAAERILGAPLEREHSLMDLLKRPEVRYASLGELSGIASPVEDASVAAQVEIQAKYQGYVARQREEIERHERYESLALPSDLDYDKVRGLSIEVRQKLKLHRPETMGQASRISGMTPAAISLLLVHMKRRAGPVERTAA